MADETQGQAAREDEPDIRRRKRRQEAIAALRASLDAMRAALDRLEDVADHLADELEEEHQTDVELDAYCFIALHYFQLTTQQIAEEVSGWWSDLLPGGIKLSRDAVRYRARVFRERYARGTPPPVPRGRR